jgi:Ca2+-binding RTX toxin-like protein
LPRRISPALERLEQRRLFAAAGGGGGFALDETWGSGGFVDAPRDTQRVTGVTDLAGAADGSVVALPAGDVREVIRYRADGTIDTAFGNGGVFLLPIDATRIAVAADGSIFAAGAGAAVRLTPAGRLDSSFGSGGVAILANGGATIDRADDLLAEADGSAILLRSGTLPSLAGQGTTTVPAAVITHLRPDGSPDTRFDGDGVSAFALPTNFNTVFTVQAKALTPDGQVLLGGTGLTFGHVAVERVTDVGVLDQSFQIDVDAGETTNLIALDTDAAGGVVMLTSAVGATPQGPTVHTFDAAGSETAAFTIAPESFSDVGTAVAAQPQGRVLVGFDRYAVARLVRGQVATGVLLRPDGTLEVTGTADDDVIIVNRATDRSQLRVTRNGKHTFIDRARVTNIALGGGDGSDVLTATVDVPTRAAGDAGNDAITSAGANDILDGGDGDDTLTGGAGRDILTGSVGADLLTGGSGADKIAGEGGKDRIFGGSGNDRIDGGAADDRLLGQSGNDTIQGGRGNDILDGGSGRNVLLGGPGSDTIVSVPFSLAPRAATLLDTTATIGNENDRDAAP